MRLVVPVAAVLLATCGPRLPEGAEPDYTETREACADRDPHRRAYWGDLHVHGAFSFDARNYGTTVTPEQVYAFARGEVVRLAPLDDDGLGTREVRLDRPLDFLSATEHGDFLGEVAICTTPEAPGNDAAICDAYRGVDADAAFDFGLMLAADDPRRPVELCGEDGTGCDAWAEGRWELMRDAAEAAYDRTAACELTTFVGYEYTNTYQVSNLHRNVIFRNADVPSRPVTTFEATTPLALWQQLDAQCVQSTGTCDVLVLPHNSNLSNGRLFDPGWVDAVAGSADEAADLVALRARMEPVVEIFQHKGDSECRNGHGAPHDPQCAFEKLRPPDDETCGDTLGAGGMRLWGCSHRLDFVRAVLGEGLAEEGRDGFNPYRLGFIGSTDTHNGTPGLVRSVDFPGHVGIVDDTPEERLGAGNITHDAFINNPGGLAGVWAVENSRDAIFEAIRRRETFASSGPRIPVRMFAGYGLPADLCERDDRVERAYAGGVPMGGVLEARDRAPRIAVWAEADEGTEAYPGVGLERIQIVKGWVEGGVTREEVVDVVTTTVPGSLDEGTCDADGGAPALCAVWEDPDWSPGAFYYARVLEVPTCRWSTRECAAFAPDARPERCDAGIVEPVVQQRAWGSPIWTE